MIPVFNFDEFRTLSGALLVKFCDPNFKPSNISEILELSSSVLSRSLKRQTSDIRLVEEAIESAMVQVARQLIADQFQSDPLQIYQTLVDLHDRQPSLNSRSSTRLIRQQFSTPIPLAYLTACLTNVSPTDRVHDPTAGHGALTLTADPKYVTANEIDRTRRESLLLQGYQPSGRDATSDLFDDDRRFDVALVNPPFGRTKAEATPLRFAGQSRTLKTRLMEFVISFHAIHRLQSNGRAALLVPGRRGDDATRCQWYNKGFIRNFYYFLYQTFNVTHHFTTDGALWKKQGCGQPVDVIVINGWGKSSRSLPAADAPKTYTDWAELLELLRPPPPQAEPTPVIVEISEIRSGSPSSTDPPQPPAVEEDGTIFYPSGVRDKNDFANFRATGLPRLLIDQYDFAHHIRRDPDAFASCNHICLDVGSYKLLRQYQQGKRKRITFDLDQYLRLIQDHREKFTHVVAPDVIGDDQATETYWHQVKSLDIPWMPVVQWDTSLMDVNRDRLLKLLDEAAVVGIGGLVAPLRDLSIRERISETLATLCRQYPHRLHFFGLHYLPAIEATTNYAFSFDTSKWLRVGMRGAVIETDEEATTLREVERRSGTKRDRQVISALNLTRYLETQKTRRAETPSESSVLYINPLTSPKDNAQVDPELDPAEEKPRLAPESHQRNGAESLTTRLIYQIGIGERVLDGEDFHLRIEKSPYLPLVIERHGEYFYVTHYRSENGELFIDSEVVFLCRVGQLTLIETATYNPFTGGEYRTRWEHADRSFAKLMISNALDYGFGAAGRELAIQRGWIAAPPAEPDVIQPEVIPPRAKIPYIPQSKGPRLNTVVPHNLATVTEEAMHRLTIEVGGDIDDYVRDRCCYETVEEMWRHLAAEQIDTIALCIYNLERNYAAIVGHATGIGKGRIMAGLLRYIRLKLGKTVIFMTQGSKLYADILRDTHDVGLPGLRPFATNESINIPLPDGRRIQQSPQSHKQQLKAMIDAKSTLDYDLVTTTYFQLQTVKAKAPKRREFLKAIAKGAIILADESHCAGGGTTPSAGNRPPNRAEFMRHLRDRSDGIIFASATFCKEPHVLSLYAPVTEMKFAVEDERRLISLIYSGGIPLQQALSQQLTQAIQYLRLEQSYEGVEFHTERIAVDHAIADAFADCLNLIYEFDSLKQIVVAEKDRAMKEAAKLLLKDNATGDAGVDGVDFTSIMHNLVGQFYLSMKVDGAVQLVQQAIARNEKPIIGLYNTFGSFLQNFVEDNHIKPGDPIESNIGDLLLRYLNRCRIVIVRSPKAEKAEWEWLTDADLGKAAVYAYDDAYRQILRYKETLFQNVSASPLDALTHQLTRLGLKVGEVTARQHAIEYRDGGTYYRKRSTRETKSAAHIETVNQFNNGQLDVLLINTTGSTGISIHSSVKFKDQRVRHLIQLQLITNIIELVQLFGRFNRTGQRVPPKYTITYADIPGEWRIIALVKQRLASLNASVVASRQSDVKIGGCEDFFNEWGDMVAEQLLSEDPDLDRRLKYPLLEEDGFQAQSPIQKMTGRIPMLSVADQEETYRRLEQRYQEYRELQESIGNYLLEAKTLDLRAEVLECEEILPRKVDVDSVFGEPVYLEQVMASLPHQCLSRQEVVQQLSKSLSINLPVSEIDGSTIQSHRNQWVADQCQWLEAITKPYMNDSLAKLPELDETHSETLREQRQQRRIQIAKTIQSQLDDLIKLSQEFAPGTAVELTSPLGSSYVGVVGQIGWREKLENPVRPSNWRVQILVADDVRSLWIQANHFNNGGPGYRWTVTAIEDEAQAEAVYNQFSLSQTQKRVPVNLITGNILRAFDRLGYMGTLINFTTVDDKIRQGILVKRNIDVKTTLAALHKESQARQITTADDAIILLMEGGVTLFTGDRLLALKWDKEQNCLLLQTFKSAIGRRYTMNVDLLRHAQAEFYSAGSKMRLTLSPDRIEAVLNWLYDTTGTLVCLK